MLDIFKDDAFSLVNLTQAIQDLPVVPQRLNELGLFRTEPVSVPFVSVEWDGAKIYLIQSSPRGTTTQVATLGKRKMRAWPIPYLALDAEVFADDVAGLRAFGREDQLESASTIVNAKLLVCKNSHEATKEYHRAGALAGVVLDADGTTEITDLFTILGVTEEVVDFDWSDPLETNKGKALDVQEHIDDNIGGQPYDHVHALCGATFWRDMVESAPLSEAYNEQTGFAYATEGRRDSFEFGGITWEPYRAKVGARNFIDANQARFFPVGAPDLFVEAYAPAPFMETVNTPGAPYYAKQRPKPYDTGIDIHTCSSPGMYCNRPAVLVKGTNSTP